MKPVSLRSALAVRICILLALLAFAWSQAAAERVIVKLRAAVVPPQSGPVAVALRRHGARGPARAARHARNAGLASRIGLDRTWVLDAPNAAALCRELATLADVEYAQPPVKVRLALTPNDTSFVSQWALNNTGVNGGVADADIDAPEAWDTTAGSSSVAIAIIDTGVDVDHPDLASKLVAGYDFANGDSDTDDDHGHGTNCAGIAAAVSNNALGMASVSWGAQVMPIKVIGGGGTGDDVWCGDGLIWAADHGANVASLSLVLDADSQYVRDATAYAIGSGVAVVAAMGNDGSSTVRYPAGYPGVIAVGSTDWTDAKAGYSNWGSHIAVMAPGVQIYTTARGGGYTSSFGGTSAATPHVSGICSLMLSLNPALTPANCLGLVKQSADDRGARGWDQYYGSGRANARRALLGVQDPSGPTIEWLQAYSAATTEIRAAWSAQDEQSGIEYSEYCIGTTPGGTNVRTWTKVGAQTQVVVTGLSLSPGLTYYLTLNTPNGAGLAATVNTNVIRSIASCANLTQVKSQSDGAAVTLTGRIVTAVFADGFYIQEPARASGIKVISATPVQEGSAVSVTGILQTSGGERSIRSAHVEAL